MKVKRYLTKLGERCDVKLMIPPARAIEIAAERTDGMVDYFQVVTRDCNYLGFVDYLERLVRSAYLQGVEDAAVAMAMTEKARGEQ